LDGGVSPVVRLDRNKGTEYRNYRRILVYGRILFLSVENSFVYVALLRQRVELLKGLIAFSLGLASPAERALDLSTDLPKKGPPLPNNTTTSLQLFSTFTRHSPTWKSSHEKRLLLLGRCVVAMATPEEDVYATVGVPKLQHAR
jgi:hypothetical protein